MKKLIMAAYHTAAGCRKAAMVCAVVCAAVTSEAATFSWSADSTQYMPTSWANKTAGDNQASGSTNAKKIQGWVNGGMDFTAAVFLSTDGTAWTESAAKSYDVYSDNSNISIEAIDNSLWPNPMADKTLYYKVVITGTYTDDKGTWTATGTIGGSGEYVELTAYSADQLDTGTVGSWDISFQGTGPVPEPTSGLMLLLGIGALALRRKQK